MIVASCLVVELSVLGAGPGAEELIQTLPVVQVQQQGVAALHVLLVDFHHQHVVGHPLH